ELEGLTGNTVKETGLLFKSKKPKFKGPYHFVFLDGCETAKGKWCEAFGIDRIQTTSAGYVTNNSPTQAFLGWTEKNDICNCSYESCPDASLYRSVLEKFGSGNAAARNEQPGNTVSGIEAHRFSPHNGLDRR